MPDLALPIEGYQQPEADPNGYALPVAQPIPDNIPRVIINTGPKLKEVEHDPWATGKSAIEKLFGLNGQERYQTWPEKLIRSGVTAAGDALSGDVPQWQVDPATGDVHTSPQMIERAMDMSSVAGTGGLAGADASLGSGPMLRPALKYKDKIYKAPVGGQHLDALPPELYPEFQKMAMSGEDISHYNFGFMNHKGQFLDREKALDYAVKEGLVDPTAGQYGVLTSTLLADSSKPGTAIEAMAKSEPFYSALEHNVSNINQSKMNGDAWLGTLSNKPGVKPEELQWTGLKDFLEENKGKPVTKAQIEEHLQNNKVELKEVDKGTGELKKAAEDLQAAVGNDKVSVANHRDKLYADEIEQGLWSGDIIVKDLPTNLQPHAEKMLSLRHQQENPTKYHSYQLPGGENYREKLLTLPSDIPKFQATQKANDARIRELRDSMHGTSGSNEIRSEISKLQNENQSIQKQIREANLYKSSHWDEPNILAHVRMNDRVIDGKKSLHLEEIQSDWHQQGRDKGYKNEDVVKNYDQYAEDLRNRAKAHWNEEAEKLNLSQDRADIIRAKTLPDDLPIDKVANYMGETDKLRELWQARQEGIKGVPDAPFKKSWHELALKRMIREAAEKGYDRLSWTPGEAQAARYDLSKSVDKLQYNPDTQKLLGHKGNSLVVDQTVPKDKLADFVGKEAADKIINKPTARIESPNNKGTFNHYLEGQDLKIGGEGMKGFYDQIIPKSLEKISGQKVKQSIDPNAGEKFAYLNKKSGNKGQEFKSQEEAKAWLKESRIDPDSVTLLQVNRRAKEGSKFEPVHYIDIPQSLKNTAMHKGFPLFAKGVPLPLMPIDHDPFEKKK